MELEPTNSHTTDRMTPPPLPHGTRDSEAIEKVRTGQRFVINAVMLNLSLLLLGLLCFAALKNEELAMTCQRVFAFATIFGYGIAIFGVVRLSSGLGYGLAVRIPILIAIFIPYVGLIVLLVLIRKGTAVLRSSGYKVGLFGAAPKAV
jgi:hypothetical protein